MSVRVNTNVDAFDAQRNLGLVSMDFSKSVQRLSSGLRINSSADDAAGLSISQKLEGQVRGFDQGGRNAQDAISMIQTGESALGTTHSILQRMRQLAIQSANDTYTSQDRANIQSEIFQLIQEVDRIAQQTDFNTKKLLDGTSGAVAIGAGGAFKSVVAQAGVALAGTYTITAGTAATRSAVEGSTVASSFFTTTSSITITGALGSGTFTASANERLEDFFGQVNNAGIGVTVAVDTSGKISIANNNFGTGTVSGGGTVSVSNASGDFTTSITGTLGSATTGSAAASGSTLLFSSLNVSNAMVNIQGPVGTATLITATGFNSDIINGGIAGTAGVVITLSSPGTALTATTFRVLENLANIYHVGANANQTVSLVIDPTNSTTLGVGGLDLTTQANSESAITTLDNAIQYVSSNRSSMGAVINRLTNSMTNDMAAQENALAAQSRIRDTNVAQETVAFTRAQILMQAGTAVLAQANQAPTAVLALLR